MQNTSILQKYRAIYHFSAEKLSIRSCAWTFLLVCISACQSSEKNMEEVRVLRPPVAHASNTAPLSPEESIKTMHLPDGFRMELVAAEPLVQEPVAVVWDANGDMYVAEMNTYMQDIEATGQDLPLSSVVKLEDTDGDGKMDKRTVFIDSLVLPRMLLPLDDRLLVQETYSTSIHAYRDTDGDGRADEKKLVYHSDVVDRRNLEHQNSGLVWNLDNWIYTSIFLRYKWTGDKLQVDSLKDVPWGQWGLANDDYGRLFLSSAGGETVAKDFQHMPAYGDLNVYDAQYEEGFHEPWPIIATPDVEGGKKRLSEDSTLNHFTGACGQTIYRGDQLPGYMRGDLFVCEPVGRLVRRAKVVNDNGTRVLKNPYGKAEFLASTDMNFRPVNMATGPDGHLYLVDMYRGIIQEGTWTGPASYLRPQILRFGLEKNIGRGRIYRIVHDHTTTPAEKPSLLQASSHDLVNYLSHPNGWWRDNAQKLLVLRNDAATVPELKKLALQQTSFIDRLLIWRQPTPVIARIHALWTLESMQAVDKELLLQLLKDESPEMRRMAIWVSEPFIAAGDTAILGQLKQLISDTDVDVKIQLALSLQHGKMEEVVPWLEALVAKDDTPKMLYRASQMTLQFHTASLEVPLKTEGLSDAEKLAVQNGAKHYKFLCSSCHGPNGKGISLAGGALVAPPLSGSPRVNGDVGKLVRILFNGLEGPVDGVEYPSIMPSQRNNDDQWLMEVISYIRTNLGNNASPILSEQVSEVRKAEGGRWKPWTLEELEKMGR